MKPIKIFGGLGLSVALFFSCLANASAMVGADGKPAVVPSSPDQMVIMMEPAGGAVAPPATIKAPTDSEKVDSDHVIYYMDGAKAELLVNKTALEQRDVRVFSKDKCVMVPLRLIAEAMGYQVNWDGKTNSVTIEKSARIALLQIGKDSYSGEKKEPIQLGMAPVIVKDHTYVPLSFVEKFLKADVKSNGSSIEIESK